MGLMLNDKEMKLADEFKNEHCGHIYYKVYPTGIGMKIMICCEGCKVEEDITDYESW